jgi:hypothetical protein
MRRHGWMATAAAGVAGVGIGLGVALGVQPADAASQVRVTPGQLLINQRISQAGVRRSNQALTLLAPLITQPGQAAPAGWGSAQIANGAITPQDLANPNLYAVASGGAAAGATRLVRGSGATAVTRLGPGSYAVTFNRAVSSCAYVASAGDPGSAAAVAPAATSVSAQAGNANGVVVRLSRVGGPGGGDPLDTTFHLVVDC